MEVESPALQYTYTNIRDSGEEQERCLVCKQKKRIIDTWSILTTLSQSAMTNFPPSRQEFARSQDSWSKTEHHFSSWYMLLLGNPFRKARKSKTCMMSQKPPLGGSPTFADSEPLGWSINKKMFVASYVSLAMPGEHLFSLHKVIANSCHVNYRHGLYDKTPAC